MSQKKVFVFFKQQRLDLGRSAILYTWLPPRQDLNSTTKVWIHRLSWSCGETQHEPSGGVHACRVRGTKKRADTSFSIKRL